MSDSRYTPSNAVLELADNSSPTAVPVEVLKKIKTAWIAGLISTAFTLIVTLLAVFGVRLLGFDAWEFVDVALLVGLTYGIYRKSRACAVLMVIYFVASKILLFIQTGKPSGIVLGLVFAYFYVQGVVGTFAYHKHIQQAAQTSALPKS